MAVKMTQKEILEFSEVMQRNFKKVTAKQLDTLLKHAKSLSKLHEDDCNYGLTPRQQKREERLEAEIKEICKTLKAKFTINGDPRGYSVYIHMPDGTYNSWGGRETGYGIG